MDSIIQALWLFFPAAAANATPVFVSRIYILRGWSQPIDGGRKFRGQRIFGANKTWRGTVSGIIIAGVVGYLQYTLWPELLPLATQLPLAIALGFGALYGDMVESFFKRQLGKKSGQTWFPFDQLDYIFGAIIAALPFGILSLEAVAAIIGTYFLMHVVATYIGYLMGLRDQPI